jgi:hypothetical protein
MAGSCLARGLDKSGHTVAICGLDYCSVDLGQQGTTETLHPSFVPCPEGHDIRWQMSCDLRGQY